MDVSPVLVIFTAEQCIHCKIMRGNGKLKPEPLHPEDKWNSRYFRDLLLDDSAEVRCRIYELYFPTAKPQTIDEAVEFSTFHYLNDEVIQHTYTNNIPHHLKTHRIPSSLIHFQAYFPQFSIFAGPVWNQAFESNVLYGRVPLCRIKFSNNYYRVGEINPQLGVESPLTLLTYTNQSEELQIPHKNKLFRNKFGYKIIGIVE